MDYHDASLLQKALNTGVLRLNDYFYLNVIKNVLHVRVPVADVALSLHWLTV
jgi:hypothetical protein